MAVSFKLFHPSCHVTDDSILTVAIMDWLLHPGDLRSLLRTHFRCSPRPELFGRGFREWAAKDTEIPYGSIGNGAAMRVSPVAFAADDPVTVLRLARESAVATHSADDAIAGAEAVALGVFLARFGQTKQQIQHEISRRFGYDLRKGLDKIRPTYRFSSACGETVPVAFRAFLEAGSYEETLRMAISVGGDAGTVSCMAGAIAGAYWGIPESVSLQVLQMLDAEMRRVVLAFERRFPDAIRLTTDANRSLTNYSRYEGGWEDGLET
jgi:ADP-ribosylglycohydrolase